MMTHGLANFKFNGEWSGYFGIAVSSVLVPRPRTWVRFLAGACSFLSPTASVAALESSLSSVTVYEGLVHRG